MFDNGFRSSCVASAMYSLFRTSTSCSFSRASVFEQGCSHDADCRKRLLIGLGK